MKIKKGDKVAVITGKDKGKTGVVERAFPQDMRVLIPGVNVRKVHERSRKSEGKGQIVERPSPIHVSNVKKIV